MPDLDHWNINNQAYDVCDGLVRSYFDEGILKLQNGGTGGNTALDAMTNFGFLNSNIDYYVDSSVSSSGDGKSWNTAFKTITEAINATVSYVYCNGYLTNIHIANGIYLERINIINKYIRLVFDNSSSQNDVIIGSNDFSLPAFTSNGMYCQVRINGNATFKSAYTRTFEIMESSTVLFDNKNPAFTICVENYYPTVGGIGRCIFANGKFVVDNSKILLNMYQLCNSTGLHNVFGTSFIGGSITATASKSSGTSTGILSSGGITTINTLIANGLSSNYSTNYGGKIYAGTQSNVPSY